MAIAVLPTHLVNKIAAGEVIERPASMIKELIENSLDAGATRIDVAVEEGGKKLIAVTDNGCGMTDDDLALAFAPHATSKIAAEEDLTAIATMGFRGEALASAASVCHAHIRTRRGSEDSGYEVQASGETIGPVRPCPASPGTTITVRDLFFNMPARRKFLRTANTEFGHVTEQLARLALPHCRVAFTLSHNGREVQNLPATETTAERAADLFGPDLAEALLPVARRSGPVDVAGLLAPPAAARSSGKWQYFFLNGRYIRDRVLGHALREAFRGLIEPSRSPVAFLFLQLAPGEVDVNVHPTKIEVRFGDAQAVHGEVLAALRETLNQANLTAEASLAAAEAEAKSPGQQEADEQRRASLREALADFFKSQPPQPRLSFGEPSAPGRSPPRRPAAEPSGSARDAAATFAPARPAQRLEPDRAEPAPAAAERPSPPRRLAVQIHNTYIVAECEDGLAIIDQHALHERIIYNELRRRLAEGRLAAQRLLIPETLTVGPGETQALQARSELLAALGIEVVPFGPRTVAVQQFPSLLVDRRVPPGAFLRDFLDLLSEEGPADSERLLESVLQMMACKAAVKAGQALGAAEIDDLLARGQATDKPSACPHGRPTTLRLTLKDLERQFRRL